ncbi:hypothetical protein LCGC14_2751390 [marine sediment metagenome]|uniref:Uncharacterized protein n=1 Tax=marine sediment metagenome TaxID=412755 RepID=A0A0F9BA90_9ZZZZ
MEKEFNAWIILDWRYGNMRILKKTRQVEKIKKQLRPSEIIIDFDLKVKVPEFPIIKAKGEIELPEAKVKEILINSLENNED